MLRAVGPQRCPRTSPATQKRALPPESELQQQQQRDRPSPCSYPSSVTEGRGDRSPASLLCVTSTRPRPAGRRRRDAWTAESLMLLSCMSTDSLSTYYAQELLRACGHSDKEIGPRLCPLGLAVQETASKERAGKS